MLGMVNYLGKFLPDLSSELHPVAELLKKDMAWLWDKPQQRAFNKVKAMLSSAPALAYYDVGRPTITDHKPLVPLINACDLDKAPLRCQRRLMRLMPFNARAVHIPAKQLVVADTLSRNPLRDSTGTDTEDNVRAYIEALITARAMSESKLDLIREATGNDAVM
ncbi:hypothetical protein AAFF_G00401490 [Aldrovandia affinis]|uniref:Uncharacterized protein n=1 Tax=Aldrovandia affinis TaxID=143900 RepID=A0AAD7WKK9_9TELE|nr:hypothetical protein AAFF_G00401490 [Aldrovandia affinis]